MSVQERYTNHINHLMYVCIPRGLYYRYRNFCWDWEIQLNWGRGECGDCGIGLRIFVKLDTLYDQSPFSSGKRCVMESFYTGAVRINHILQT